MNPKVTWFFEKPTKWREAYQELRELVLFCGLTEELKWGCPCYTFGKDNVVLLHGFKEYCALLFLKGALMEDPAHILVRQTENVQSARQIRFATLGEVLEQQAVVRAYIENAIEVAKSGATLELKKTAEYKMPEEFQSALSEMADVKAAFEKLTPGRQKGYLLYFSSAKQARTRTERVEKCLPGILAGKGLDD